MGSYAYWHDNNQLIYHFKLYSQNHNNPFATYKEESNSPKNLVVNNVSILGLTFRRQL